MSDVLQKLLSVENQAQALVSEAEAQAEARKTSAKREAQKEYETLLAQKTRELEEAAAEERERAKKLRAEKLRAYTEGLSTRRRHPEQLGKALESFIFSSHT